MLRLLQVSGIALISSVFLMGICGFNGLVFTSLFTIFVLLVAINLVKLWKGKNVLYIVADKTFSDVVQCFKNKKYARSIINVITYPMCLIGIGFVILNMIFMWMLTSGKV